MAYGYDEMGSEVGADEIAEVLADIDPVAADEWDDAGADEVGARRKRRRRILGAIFGGPAGAIAAVKARRRDRRQGASMAGALNAAIESAPQRDPRSGWDRVKPGAGRKLLLGLGAVTIGINATAILDAVAQRDIQPTRLLVSSSGLADVIVTDAKVGSISQLAGIEGVPAEAFSDVAQDVGIQFDVIPGGITFSLFLTNNGAAPAAVSAMLFGVAAYR